MEEIRYFIRILVMIERENLLVEQYSLRYSIQEKRPSSTYYDRCALSIQVRSNLQWQDVHVRNGDRKGRTRPSEGSIHAQTFSTLEHKIKLWPGLWEYLL